MPDRVLISVTDFSLYGTVIGTVRTEEYRTLYGLIENNLHHESLDYMTQEIMTVTSRIACQYFCFGTCAKSLLS